MLSLLITAFGPFLSVVDNPSERIASRLSSETFDNATHSIEIFPVSYQTVTKMMLELLGHTVDIVVMLGVAQHGTMLRLETVARPDNHGELQDIDGAIGPMRSADESSLRSSIPMDRLASKLSDSGIDCAISENAGNYLCNFSYFEALKIIDENRLDTVCCFIHLPPDELTFADQTGVIGFDKLYMEVRTAIQTIVNLVMESKRHL